MGSQQPDMTELSIFIWFLYKTTYKIQAFTVHFYISVSVDLGPFESCDQFDIAYIRRAFVLVAIIMLSLAVH